MVRLMKLVAGAMAVCGVVAGVSCSKNTDFVGKWTAVAPSDITTDMTGATQASSQMTITFADGMDKADGSVGIVNDFDITRQAKRLCGSIVYVNVKGSATADGTWTYDVDDDDDLLLSFDPKSVKINIDPSAVTFTEAVPDDMAASVADSIRTAAAETCRGEMMRAMSKQLARFTVINDVEVSKDHRTMKFEVNAPEQDLHFRNADL